MNPTIVSIDEKLLLRPEEAAAVLGFSRARVYELMASGELPSMKCGRLRRIHRGRLQEFADRLAAEADKLPGGVQR